MASRRRTPRAAAAGAIAIAIALLAGAAIDPARADVDGLTFSSTADNVRMTLPRGWRISEQPSYPGIVLRMFRTRPQATMLLAIDPRPAPGAIDPSCLTRPPAAPDAPPTPQPIEMQVACEQARRLAALGYTVGPVKEAARPWFDFATVDRELRQGVLVLDDRVITLVLAAETAASRAYHARTFDKALRSLRALDGGGAARDEAADAGDAAADAPAP